MLAWNFLANGMGGIDWAGLPLAVAYAGITDVPAVVDRLLIIKTHKPPEVADVSPPPQGGAEN